MESKFDTLFVFLPESKIKKIEAKEEGKYPYFTPGSPIPKRTDKAQYTGPALIISKTGNLQIFYCEGKFSTTSNCMVAVPQHNNYDPCIITRYTYYYLLNNSQVLQDKLRNNNTLSKDSINNLAITLKEIETMSEIVAILGKIENVIWKRKTINIQFSKIKKSLFLQLFGDPVIDEGKYSEILPFEKIAQIILGGHYKTESDPQQGTKQLALLTQTAITRHEFDPTQNKILRKGQYVRNTHIVKKGDVLISRINSHALLGRAVYLYDIPPENLIVSDKILRIEYNREKISGIYLTYLFNDDNFHKKLMNYSGGTLQNMPAITVKSLRKFSIPCADRKVQQRFEDSLLKIREMEQRSVKQLEWLFKLMAKVSQDLFAGKEIKNIQLVLETLLHSIDLESDENDYSSFKKKSILDLLIHTISHETDEIFPNIDTYNRAKKVLFALIKKGIITQRYNPEQSKMELRTT